MFAPVAVMSAAQHEALDGLITDALDEGKTIDGLLVENPVPSVARFVLVLDDEPQTGSEYDRVYDFDGAEIARGDASVTFVIEQTLGGLLAGAPPADLAA